MSFGKTKREIWRICSEDQLGAAPQYESQLPNSPEGAANQKMRKGWHPNAMTHQQFPRYTMGRGGFQKKERSIKEDPCVRKTMGGAFRKTFFDMMNLDSTPGPGMYKTEREFPTKDKLGVPMVDEVNTNLTVQEEAADFSFPKTITDRVALQLSCDVAKASSLVTGQRAKPSTQVMFTPGPGHYTQSTQFGAASGGSRKHYS